MDSIAAMDGDRISQALARIEAASRRIETIAARPAAAPAAAGDPDLERRHAALRSEAGAALRDLDSLIAELQR
ncbi:hypothetical protein GRI89_04010 [Altererythrobacter salegens]|uniref:Uncharacterized protein n=1 Tax=Croceibacterium salegens TaxID=1737568 RepID=A0A6I4SS91_9SPHN|nr:hypothetical protein [Croceibacterium salegens]MXO58705.1 hypothetical protein [Croceibacterium salegens]